MKTSTLQIESSKQRAQSIIQATLQVSLGALFLAFSSQIALTMPFSCVPFTFQPQAVLALALLFGPKRALQSVMAFLCMGAMGLPVFAQGAGSIFHLAGPRGGYLMSYLLVAPLVGYLTERSKSFLMLLGSLFVGNALIFACGFLWLSLWIGMPQAFAMGVVPFLLPDVAKVLLLASSAKIAYSLCK